MKKKIICFGVRDYEVSYFEEISNLFDYEIELRSELLTNETYELALNYECVLIRANCYLDSNHLNELAKHGLKYLVTRTKGYNHLEIETLKELGIKSAYVPTYSPNSVSELALTLTMMLVRNVSYACNETRCGNYQVTSNMFSREIRDCTIGILGSGKIGLTTAKLFKGLGSNVVGYNRSQSKEAKEIVEFLDLPTFIQQSDVIICHMSYTKGENDNFIDANFISQMKKNSILINVARGELLDTNAALDAIKNNKLAGLGLDVIKDEKDLLKEGSETNKIYKEIQSLYPRVLLTPHIGSATVHALKDTITTSFENFDELIKTGKCKYQLS